MRLKLEFWKKENSQKKIENKTQELQNLLKQIVESRKNNKSLDKLKPLSQNSKRSLKKENIIENKPISFSSEMVNLKDQEKRDHENKFFLDFKSKILERGMSKKFSEKINQEIINSFSPLDEITEKTLLEKAEYVLSNKIKASSDLIGNINKKKVIFFVGPTGSGKTTTIAKLCSMYHFHLKKSVSLYTTDNYRIAAIEQLKKYANTIGVPFFPIKNKKQMSEVLSNEKAELILIDTAGYNHKNQEKLKSILQYEEILKKNNTVMEYILVLPATINHHTIKSILKSYDFLDYNRILVTKVDEAEFLDIFIELLYINNKIFSFLSIGQEVPFDILTADKKLISNIVLYPEQIKNLKGKPFA